MLQLLAAEGPNGRFLPSDIKEFWWSTAAFCVVVALILWKLLPVIKAGLSGRSERIQEEIVASERARVEAESELCLLYTSPSPRDRTRSRMPSSA